MASHPINKAPLAAFNYMVNHVFLPPKLPQGDEFDPQCEIILLKTICNALHSFKSVAGDDQRDIIDSMYMAINNLRNVTDDLVAVNETALEDAMHQLSKTGMFLFLCWPTADLTKNPGGCIPLYVRAQNAGIIISKVGHDVIFEAFELSPRNKSVLAAKGRLRRSFPACAVAVVQSTFDEDGFVATLAQAITKMSHQLGPDSQPKVWKADQEHEEMRDTAHPCLITEHLMSFLRAVGKPKEVSMIWKNTREEVLWSQNLLPWRRSSLWLLVRVVMQLGFSRAVTPTTASAGMYKAFMVFLLARILKLSNDHIIDSDLLRTMNAKLSQRLLKLGAECASPWIQEIRLVMVKVQEIVEGRWQDIINQTQWNLNMSCLKSLSFPEDVNVQVPGLDDYIFAMAKRVKGTACSRFSPSSQIPTFASNDLPFGFDSVIGDYKTFAITAFESWVDSHLSSWLNLHISEETTCERLRDLIERYHRVAGSSYAQNPEGFSVMLLTITELWIACDKSACTRYYLLRNYDPEIPLELLQCLILPSKCQMQRLLKVEEYIEERRARVNKKRPSILRDFGHPLAFSVTFFDQSSELQSLRSQIESKACQDKEEKCRELSQKKARYRNLMQLHDQSTCEYEEVIVDSFDNFTETCHSNRCQRCKYKQQAHEIGIRVHEWPLPRNDSSAKSTVFELRAPTAFREWRDATVYFLNDGIGCNYDNECYPEASYILRDDHSLSPYFSGSRSGKERLGLLSQVKSHLLTHRRYRAIINMTEADVCLNNGLKYQYHDRVRNVFTSTFSPTQSIVQSCTYKLPERSSALQKFLTRPHSMPNGPPPNAVLAGQSDCPSHMSLDEFKAFCSIPLGVRIQWMNILVQLAIPSLDFAKVETAVMVLQTICQAGPPAGENVRRASHEVLGKDRFCIVFLEHLRRSSERMKANWESSRALMTFIRLAARLLSLSPSIAIRNECLAFLSDARGVALSWLYLLRDKAHGSRDVAQRKEFLSSVVEVALVCVNTFEVDQEHLNSILRSFSDASIYIQCSIAIQENALLLGKNCPFRTIIYERWRHLSYRAFPLLAREIIGKRDTCLDGAVVNYWPDYRAAASWQAEASPFGHWLYTSTMSEDGADPLSVHFNLLTAELLVNGLPLARLPAEYECHPTYVTLFGHSTLEVIPTKAPGMTFSAKQAWAGFTLHFGLQSVLSESGMSRADLLVHAVRDGQRYDLIPRRLLQNRLPVTFVNDFVHWYHWASQSIEFCPIQKPWSLSPANWRFTKKGPAWCLGGHGVSLINVLSETARTLADIFSPLEDRLNIHISFHGLSAPLTIELPRLRLGFDLTPGASLIESRDFRGSFVDSNQDVGTLIGLRSKLVLKRDDVDSRMVIIPDGPVAYRRALGHIEVTIERITAKAHVYHIDKRLGRMMDNGNIRSKLFLCYLHGLTSYCLPDQLTKRTGTEQALSILESGAVRSFDRLDEQDIAILERIARLAPGRAYYPTNKRVMQKIIWDPSLSFMSQDGMFFVLAEALFKQAKDGQIFYPNSCIELPSMDFTDHDLLERDIIRSSTFRVFQFGAETFSTEHDSKYTSRDRGQNSERASRTFVASSLIFQNRVTLHAEPLYDLDDFLWGSFKNCGVIRGPGEILEQYHFCFDSKWLEEPLKHLGPIWCRAHLSLSKLPDKYNKFRIMMWLSTMAFAKDIDMQIIQTLATFYNVQDVATINPPAVDYFHLSLGAEPSSQILRQIVKSVHRSFKSCPEASFPKEKHETWQEVQQRRQRLFNDNLATAVHGFVQELERQWPCKRPQTPVGDSFATYIDTSKAIENIREKFKIWFANYCFQRYLRDLKDTLRNQAVDPIRAASNVLPSSLPTSWRSKRYIDMDDLFAALAPVALPKAPESPNLMLHIDSQRMSTNPKLASLLPVLKSRARTKYEKSYVTDLVASFNSLQVREKKVLSPYSSDDMRNILERYLIDYSRYVEELYSMIIGCTGEDQPSYEIAAAIFQWPRMSPILLLQQLIPQHWHKLTMAWKICVVRYGLALTELQRAERLIKAASNPADLVDELLNVGHTNWDPFDFPESLLLEVESGIMIRAIQEDIAGQMRNPPKNANGVMQLNMGEGKSSIIVPIVALALASRTVLVRVIVARPQSKQMFQMLVSKLGGLLGRRIYHIPFSRALPLDILKAEAIGKICRECRDKSGILLVQPEHVLSLKLMGLERLIAGEEPVGRSLLETQRLFDTLSRDIVDESDEIFSVKFELVYTMGTQRPIDFSPDRWTIVQKLLDLVARFAPKVKRELPCSIEVDDRRSGRFPKIRVLRFDAQELINERIAKYICKTGLPGFPIAHQPKEVRNTVFRFITQCDLTMEEIIKMKGYEGSFWTNSTKNALFLTRGLIAGGVIAFIFGQKRWRVDYGLDPDRLPKTNLAVPFWAKDNPTPRSEFSHPDVVLLLTSISYYYAGLNNDDLFASFEHLLMSDQANLEYEEWTSTAPSLPSAFRQLGGINLKDRLQCIEHIFPHLQYSKRAIDYFLSRMVFPKQMREFPYKISASGWDIGQIKSHPTTGFSGTNDSCQLLPLNVGYFDLAEQKHTNALVLGYLLQEENCVELLGPRSNSMASDAKLLLAVVTRMRPVVRVILDVGAQIIELSNEQVAQRWLNAMNSCKDTEAVVFFNDKHELSVMDRKGNIELLHMSPFAEQLDRCLVFLDEAHTRGTDLKLPRDYRAAVTLGANLTKDRLVQGNDLYFQYFQ